MNYSKNAWNQLKSKTDAKLISALLKDGFQPDAKLRAERVYRHSDGRKVTIHYHTGKKTYGPKLLKGLLEDIGWTEDDLRRLKLIK